MEYWSAETLEVEVKKLNEGHRCVTYPRAAVEHSSFYILHRVDADCPTHSVAAT